MGQLLVITYISFLWHVGIVTLLAKFTHTTMLLLLNKMIFSFFFSSNVPLSFEWIFYNPRTELRGSDDSTEVTPPIPLTDQSSPFTVNTPNGTLLPREAKPFTFSFLPIEVHAHTLHYLS